jgi:hypothetical protein
MPDAIFNEVWPVLKQPTIILIYLGIAYLSVRLFHETIRDAVVGLMSEFRLLFQPEMSTRRLNAIFGAFGFIAMLLTFAEQEITEARQLEVFLPGQFIFFVGTFLLILFFALSVAFCIMTDR